MNSFCIINIFLMKLSSPPLFSMLSVTAFDAKKKKGVTSMPCTSLKHGSSNKTEAGNNKNNKLQLLYIFINDEHKAQTENL